MMSVLVSILIANAQVTDCFVDFATVKKQVLEPQCLKCHNAAKAKGDIVLETYEQTFSHINKIKTVVETDEMPPIETLLPEQKKALLDWIGNDAPENVDPTQLCEI